MSTAATAVTVYASRSISWDTTTLPSGATFQGGVLFPDTVMEERCDDDSVITENPVEVGTVNNDHAYDLAQDLEVVAVWDPVKQANGQPGFLDTTYEQLRNLKQAKIFLNVVTGKRAYQNLLLKNISVINDADTENILMARLTFKQLILALTQTVTISSAAQQANPQQTAPTINNGNLSLQPGTNYNSGN
jgi:Dit-like tail protein